jgi:hypothetical protein
MTSSPPLKNPSVAARLAMVDGYFELPEVTKSAMNEIRIAVAACASQITTAMSKQDSNGKNIEYDIGRLIYVLDTLQIAKNAACDSLILPHHPKQVLANIETKNE